MSSEQAKACCIHIFRRDYRLEDNTTLIEALKTHETVIPIFIFTSRQIDPKKNEYRSDNAVQFLCESLADLNKQLRAKNSQLFCFYDDGKIDEIELLEDIIDICPDVKTVSFNMDYTNYSKKRDAEIVKLCADKGLTCLIKDDICLNPVGTIVTGSGKPYSKFTPFWRTSAAKDIPKPAKNAHSNYLKSKSSSNTLVNKLNNHKYSISMSSIMTTGGKIIGPVINDNLPERGGRDNGQAILKKITEWKDYEDQHDQLTYNTTHLSPFNKYGCVSIREVYWTMMSKLGKDNPVIRQLFWRDFFYHLSNYYPEIYTAKALNPKYRNIKWSQDTSKLKAWQEGRTGFPIVDACMRELNTTGYMHNRGRLITSSFLCRMLSIDWKEGEKYFARKLYDYDPAQNNFGWQVSGANSSGTTSRPLEQTILNPWIQGAQFDRDGKYIKKWCPELEDVNPSHLHKWDQYASGYIKEKGIKYLEPIIDYKVEKEKNLKMYKKYLK